jgi:hypothetical protein
MKDEIYMFWRGLTFSWAQPHKGHREKELFFYQRVLVIRRAEKSPPGREGGVSLLIRELTSPIPFPEFCFFVIL